MIKTLSPYYLNIPFVSPLTDLTCTSFTLNLYVWNGNKSDVPATATYTITKENPTSDTGNAKINIARLISDFIDFTPNIGTTTEVVNGNNQQWVKWETFYATSNPVDASTPTNQNTKLFLKGFSYGLEGENATTPTNKVLIPIQEYKVNPTSKFIVPVVIDETEITLATLTIDDITFILIDEYSLEYTSTGNIADVYYRYKLEADTDWTFGFETATSSPFNITLPTISGTYNVQIFAYDNDNAVDVYSNIFNVIVA